MSIPKARNQWPWYWGGEPQSHVSLVTPFQQLPQRKRQSRYSLKEISVSLDEVSHSLDTRLRSLTERLQGLTGPSVLKVKGGSYDPLNGLLIAENGDRMLALTPQEFIKITPVPRSYQTTTAYLSTRASKVFHGSDWLSLSSWVASNIGVWANMDNTDIRIIVLEKDVVHPEWGPVIP